ncbi:XRE family transcriptional regulator [Salmonella enterica]|nr:XRE family transcriptional regulator [Salmonella enterica]
MLKDILRQSRERLKLKQMEVADYVGVTTQTYMKWENGKNEPKANNIKKLAEILNVSETEICRGEMYDIDIYEQVDFMKKVASLQNSIDEVTFTSLLYHFIKDKSKFISRLEREIKNSE